MKRRLLIGIALAVAIDFCGGVTTNTGQPDAATPCTPGISIACTGVGGCSGGQVCNATGSAFGPCDCGDLDASAPVDSWIDAQSDDVIVKMADAPPIQTDGSSGGDGLFAFVINGGVQTPMSCSSADWEFSAPGSITSVAIVNTGTVPLPYIAQSWWTLGAHYVPGVSTGDTDQVTGVLAPGDSVDITSIYLGGYVALLGSSEPFSDPDAGKYVSDEGTIPWPTGVSGSEGSATMYIAELQVPPSGCRAVVQSW